MLARINIGRITIGDRRCPEKWTAGYKVRTQNIGLREASMDFLDLHGKEVTGTVLNCGSAFDRFRYWRFFPNRSRYQLLDRNPTWKVKMIIADVQNMPEVPEDSEDCIVAYWLIDLVSSPERTLAEFWRVLKPGGMLLIGFLGNAHGIGRRNRKFTLTEALTMVQLYFKVEDFNAYCEKNKPTDPAYLVEGKRLICTFIRATPKDAIPVPPPLEDDDYLASFEVTPTALPHRELAAMFELRKPEA